MIRIFAQFFLKKEQKCLLGLGKQKCPYRKNTKPTPIMTSSTKAQIQTSKFVLNPNYKTFHIFRGFEQFSSIWRVMAKYEQGTIVASAGLEGFPLNPAEVKTFSTPPV